MLGHHEEWRWARDSSDLLGVGRLDSDGSLRGLRSAVEAAAVRDAIVTAFWQSPCGDLFGTGGSYVPVDEGELVGVARETLATAIATVAVEHPDRIGPPVAEGDPAETLCDHADNANLLVVGSRGQGTVGGLLLGSASSKCARHCYQPVLIVPSGDRAGADR